MSRREVAVIGALVWAVTGAVVALLSIPSVNDDSMVLVVAASVSFPLCAVGAGLLLEHHRDRLAGMLLVVSVATPTYFAHPLNLSALVVGIALMTAPVFTLGRSWKPEAEGVYRIST